MKTLRLALLASLSFSFAACGKVVPLDGDGGVATDGRSGDGGDDLSDGSVSGACEAPIAFEDLGACLTEAQCQQFTRCTSIFKDLDECTTYLPSLFGDFTSQVELFGFAIDAGKANYDPNVAADCLAGFATASCDGEGPEEACDAVFRGTTPPNGTCLEEFECAALGSRCNNDQCDGTVECCTGFCASPVATGQDCSNDPCQPGDICVFSGGSITCQSGDMGSECNDTFECDDNMFCDFNQGRCAPDRPNGAACTDRQECSGDQDCVFGICGNVDTVGATCEFSCLGPLQCENGTCAELPAMGEACPAGQCNSILLDCVGPAAAEVCVAKQGLDEICGQRQCLPGLLCEANLPQPPQVTRCIEPLNNGSACFSDDSCISQNCAFNPQTQQAFCADQLDCYTKAPF